MSETGFETGWPADGSDEQYELAGEYVLGTLPAARRRAVQSRLEQDAGLRRSVQAWEQHLLPLTQLAEPVTPSAALWRRIVASLEAGQASAASPVAPPAHRPASAPGLLARLWASLGFWRGLSGAGLAAAAVLVALLVQPVPVPTPSYLVVLVAPQDSAPGWVVQASAPRQLDLIPLAAAHVPADKVLEFWTKADGWSAPVSLGLVQPGQTVRVPLDSLPPLENNQLFELTLEPPNGSPTGLPTGPIQFIGRAVQVL